MAMTKRVRVSFDLKVVASSKEEKSFIDNLVNVAKAVAAGEKVSGWDQKLLHTSLTEGPEAALELALKAGVVQKLKHELPEQGAIVSNFRVEVKQ